RSGRARARRNTTRGVPRSRAQASRPARDAAGAGRRDRGPARQAPRRAPVPARRRAELTADADAGALARAADEARQSLNALACELSARRKAAALSLGKKVTAKIEELARDGS